jgi:hypothetical protein
VTSLEQLSLAEFSGEQARQRPMKTAIKMLSGLDQLRLEGQNLGPFLVIKNIKNYSYVNNKSSSPIFMFLNEKKWKD